MPTHTPTRLRILTGIIMTGGREGRATVSFRPHAVSGDGTGVELRATGPDAPFGAPPAQTVSLREITLDPDGGWTRAKIDHYAHTESELEIGWSGVDEISYLILGEVSED